MTRDYQPIPKPARRRLDKDRFDDLAQPRPHRIVNEAVLAQARRQPCGWCGKPPPSHCMHVVSRGAGGSDTPENTLGGCLRCHAAQHAGQEPTPGQLQTIARIRARTGMMVVGREMGMDRSGQIV